MLCRKAGIDSLPILVFLSFHARSILSNGAHVPRRDHKSGKLRSLTGAGELLKRYRVSKRLID